VFEYLLGIGDRHADNILVRDNADIFHVDFAYLMGTKTTFLGEAKTREGRKKKIYHIQVALFLARLNHSRLRQVIW
jgi:hypothetical protein